MTHFYSFRCAVVFLSMHPVWAQCRKSRRILFLICYQPVCASPKLVLQGNCQRQNQGTKRNRGLLFQGSAMFLVSLSLFSSTRGSGKQCFFFLARYTDICMYMTFIFSSGTCSRQSVNGTGINWTILLVNIILGFII